MSTTQADIDKGTVNTGTGDAEKLAADKVAADKVAADRVAADKVAADAKAASDAAAAKAVVYDLKLSDKSELIQADVDEILALAKEKGLTNDQAALLLNQRETAAVAVSARGQEALKANVTKWVDEVKADKVLGGDNYDATLAAVKRVTDRFAPESTPAGAALMKGLNESGLGNFPPFVAFVAAIGKLMGEDKGLGGGGGTGGGNAGDKDVPISKVLFPNR